MTKPTKILIIGASARAAAQASRRAGLEVAALDLFVDRDLRSIAECETIREYPASIVEQAKHWPNHAVMFCGGMENFPDVVAELEKKHEIIGPNASQITSLRRLRNWQSWATNPGCDDWLRFPETHTEANGECDFNGGKIWLMKSHRGAGGMQVRRCHSSESFEASHSYIQRFVPGRVLGIVFRCFPQNTTILGVTRNLTPGELLQGKSTASELPPFLYAGSVGPLHLQTERETNLSEWIDSISVSVNYRGLLQADFVEGADGRLYLLEINPRWTAGMEIIEMCSGINLVHEQLRAQFQAFQEALPSESNPKRDAIKLIVYAAQKQIVCQQTSDAMMFHSSWHTDQSDDEIGITGWADIPNVGTEINVGTPVATAWGLRLHRNEANLTEGDENERSILAEWPALSTMIEKIKL